MDDVRQCIAMPDWDSNAINAIGSPWEREEPEQCGSGFSEEGEYWQCVLDDGHDGPHAFHPAREGDEHG